MSINTAMLVALGFLLAALFAVLIAPAYRRRTVRLTTEALKRTLPLTEAEMRADKDRLRADHAIRIHNLEAKLESVTLSSARQKIEVNRRDARISELEGAVGEQKTALEEMENARRVLEQTVTDRLPKLETRLVEAKKLLTQRDREITSLAETAQKQARALAEAMQINVQQSGDLERMNSALATRAARNQDLLGDARFDGEIALRAEIDALRAKTRDQSALVVRLQELVANPASGVEPSTVAAVSGAIVAAQASSVAVSEAEIHTLRADLGMTEAALRSTRAAAEAERAETAQFEIELRQLRAAKQDQAAEVARLQAALTAFEAPDDQSKSAKESPISIKAKTSALQAQTREQALTIQSLRAEVAAVNERLARQAAHYMDEMKRLGAGSLPASGDARARRPEAARKSLSDRINDPRVVRLPTADEKRAADPATPSPMGADQAKPKPGFIPVAAPASVVNLSESFPAAGVDATASDSAAAPEAAIAAPAAAPASPPRRPRLLERITNIDKPSSA
jgi:hypothetical protein